MNWRDFSTQLHLSGGQQSAIQTVLSGIQKQFYAICSRPSPNGAESPLSLLVEAIDRDHLDHERAGALLLQLLSEPEAAGESRLAQFAGIEEQARREIEAQLEEAQRTVWSAYAPSGLLDIDIGERPLLDGIEQGLDRLKRPPGFLCTSPFEYAHLQANGDVYPCCPSKFGKIIGNLRTQPLEEIWNSEPAREVRDSMLDGSYRYCNADACEYLRDARASAKPFSPPDLVAWAARQRLTQPRTSPRVVNFAFDKSCNLSCSYCRTETFRPSPGELTVIQGIDSNIFSAMLEGTERIILLGEGDPFASTFYRAKLQSYDWARHPALRIKIQTNGLLLTPEMWESIQPSHCAIDWISVSVDAAMPETYRLNRKGDFSLLLANLEFIAGLFSAGGIRHFHINFLVQANNFREIPGFAALGKRLGCDLIEFQRLENWGTFSQTEYRERAVHERYHPDHGELLQVLRDPELNHPKVWLLKLGDCVEETKAVSVISYDNCQ